MQFKTLRLKQQPGALTFMPEKPQFAKLSYDYEYGVWDLYPQGIPYLTYGEITMETLIKNWELEKDREGVKISERIASDYELVTVKLHFV